MSRILVIGSLNLDMIVNVDHTPVAGETILSDEMQMIPGGKGGNQACAAGRLGADVTMLGAVGEDLYADLQIKSLKENGVDVCHLIQRKDASTGMAIVTVNKEGDNSIIVVAGANFTLSEEDIEHNINLIEESSIVVLQMEIPLKTVVYAARRAKELGKMVILDPAPAPLDFPEELYGYVDIIKPNETELSMLTGTKDIKKNLLQASNQLRAYGVKHVIVTLGGEGVYINSEDAGIVEVPAIKVKVMDTTAAGDSFTAGLAFMLSKGNSLEEGVMFANAVAALVVTKKGAQSSMPDYNEVVQTLKATKLVKVI